MLIKNIESIPQLLEFFLERHNNSLLYRGQSNSEWKLQASLFRDDESTFKKIFEYNNDTSDDEIIRNKGKLNNLELGKIYQKIELNFINKFIFNTNKIGLRLPTKLTNVSPPWIKKIYL